MKNSTSEKSIQEAVIDLYLNVKVRKQDDVRTQLIKLDRFEKNSLEKEKEKLQKTNPILIIDYIKSSLEILIKMKVQDKLQSVTQLGSCEEFTDSEINIYEKEFRHLEAEIRNHIRIEHQLKLHIETMQSRIDELESKKHELKKKYISLQDVNNQFYFKQVNRSRENNDIDYVENLKNENLNLKQIIKSYEERNISITELERKIREKQAKHEKELKDLEDKYKEKLKKSSKIKTDENLKNPVLTKENNRITELTVDSQQLTERIHMRNASNIGLTERKKEEVSINKIEKKRKSNLSKKFSENMKNIIDDFKNKKEISFLVSKNKAAEKQINEGMLINCFDTNKKDIKNNNDFNKSNMKNESNVKLKDNTSSKLILSKLNSNKYTRNSSFDRSKQLTNNGNNHTNKNNLDEKDHLTTNNFKTKNQQKLIPSQTMTPSQLGGKNNTITPNYIPSENIIVNQNALPCFNNINIYTSNMNNFKTNEINLKQYIINKMNSKSKTGKQSHTRAASISNNANH